MARILWSEPIKVLSRIAAALLVLFGAAVLSFLAMQLMPGDPVDVMLGPLSTVSDEGRQALREKLGLDLPVMDQFFRHLTNIATLNFGDSFSTGKPVLDTLAEQAVPTFVLAISTLVFSAALAIVFAVFTRKGWRRGIANLLEMFAVSAPSFWIALILLYVFNHQLKWVSVLGSNGFVTLILPTVALSLSIIATLAQLIRQGLDSVESEPFSLTARSRGNSETRMVYRHGLRHALASTTTLSGYIFGALLGGTVLIETVFSRPGLGRVTLSAIESRDMPVVMAIIIFSALLFILLNWAVDALSALLDPRLRSSFSEDRTPQKQHQFTKGGNE